MPLKGLQMASRTTGYSLTMNEHVYKASTECKKLHLNITHTDKINKYDKK